VYKCLSVHHPPKWTLIIRVHFASMRADYIPVQTATGGRLRITQRSSRIWILSTTSETNSARRRPQAAADEEPEKGTVPFSLAVVFIGREELVRCLLGGQPIPYPHPARTAVFKCSATPALRSDRYAGP
jgi:hypothetical protein